MSKPKKPEFKGYETQSEALQRYKPQGFYAPYGQISYGDDGYKTTLDNTYYNPSTVNQYQDLRSRLLTDIMSGATNDRALDEYGQAFTDKSLEYSLPKLQASLYGRGMAGSRVSADALADLVNKASTDAVLNRAQLKSLDDNLKLAQLQATESGITSDLGRTTAQTGQLLQGAQLSQGAQAQSVQQSKEYIEAMNALESERITREADTPNWFEQGLNYGNQAAELALKVAALSNPATAPLAFMPQISGGQGGMNTGTQQSYGSGFLGNAGPFKTWSPQKVATAF